MEVSRNQLSQLTGQTHATVTKRLEGVPFVKGKHGAAIYDSKVALPLLYGVESGPESKESDREKLLRLQVETAELELEEKRENLVSVDAMVDFLGRILLACKSRLRGIATKTAPVVVTMNEAEASELISEQIDRALLEIAAGIDRLGGSADEAAASIDGLAMGGSGEAAFARGKRGTRTVEH